MTIRVLRVSADRTREESAADFAVRVNALLASITDPILPVYDAGGMTVFYGPEIGTITYPEVLDIEGLTVTSVAAGAAGAEIDVFQNSASPAANDVVARFNAVGNDDGDNATDYASFSGEIVATTDGSEAGRAVIAVADSANAGALSDVVTVSQSNMTLATTAAGAAGAELDIFHNSASPAINDVVARINAVGNDDGANSTDYMSFSGVAVAVADGSEAGKAVLSVADSANSGALSDVLVVDQSSLGLTTIAPGAVGAVFDLYQNSASPATNDVVGRINFYGEDDVSGKVNYARIDGAIGSVTAGSEVAGMSISVMNAGALTSTFEISPEVVTSKSPFAVDSIDSAAIAASGPISLLTETTYADSSGGALALTLADGSNDGQYKTIITKTAGNDVVITPVTLAGGTTITQNAAGDSITLRWLDSSWYIVGNNSSVIA